MAQALSVRILERGVSSDVAAQTDSTVTLAQRADESARSFAQRVASRLSTLSARGLRVGAASLHLSAARDGNAMARRFGLARAILSQLPTFETTELTLGGPLAKTPAGQLDLHALSETLNIELRGSKTTVRAAVARTVPTLPTWELHHAA
jgi:hypothetical protein